MLILEKLVCRDAKHHRYCDWELVSKRPDNMYMALVNQASIRVKRDGMARRLRHSSNGHVIITLKWGHDGQIFVKGSRQGAKLYLYWATHGKYRGKEK